MKFAHIGVDPGLSGACTLILPDSAKASIEVFDYVNAQHARIKLFDWYLRFNNLIAAVERVHSFPDQDVVTQDKLIRNAGRWVGILIGLGIPVVEVTPRRWQDYVKQLYSPPIAATAKPDTKTISLATARFMFPGIEDTVLKYKYHHNRADSINIAVWAANNLPDMEAFELYQAAAERKDN